MESLIESFFNPEVMKASLPYLVRGLVMTLQLSAIVIPTGVNQRRGARDALQLAQAMASRSPHHLCRLGVAPYIYNGVNNLQAHYRWYVTDCF